jgi:predicted amidophosphoribosyltransferase
LVTGVQGGEVELLAIPVSRHQVHRRKFQPAEDLSKVLSGYPTIKVSEWVDGKEPALRERQGFQEQ